MLELAQFEVLSFDCYGTLINWEQGILSALKPVLARHGQMVPDEDALKLYASGEAAAEAGEYVPYREVLRRTMDYIAAKLGFRLTEEQRNSLGDSLPHWTPFPDTVDALRDLAARYKLAIISNIDDDLLARTRDKLEVPFTHVITAESVKAYKPSPRMFVAARERLGVDLDKWLHVAQSLFHDVAPARSLGISTVHVDRRGARGGGATKEAVAKADLTVPDLASLAHAVNA